MGEDFIGVFDGFLVLWEREKNKIIEKAIKEQKEKERMEKKNRRKRSKLTNGIEEKKKKEKNESNQEADKNIARGVIHNMKKVIPQDIQNNIKETAKKTVTNLFTSPSALGADNKAGITRLKTQREKKIEKNMR